MAKRRSKTRLPRRQATVTARTKRPAIPSVEVLRGPVVVDDRIVRVVDGAMVFVEEWNGFCWLPSMLDVDSVPGTPLATRDDLRRHGIPEPPPA